MTASTRPILQAALKLPEAERADIVLELIESLSPENETLLDDAWAKELDDRWNEFQADESSAVPWSDLRLEE